ncbi:MAG: porin [Methylobacter sp.]|nr:porin [Methylobacter sp.]
MNYHPNHDCFNLKPLALSFALISAFATAHAKSLTEANSLLETMGDPNESSLMKNMGVKVGAWLNAGVTYNGNDPVNKFNGPVTFGDRSAELQLNQLNLYIQRAVATEGDAWDVGARVDVMFGTDSIFTQAYGVPAFDVNTGQPLNRGNWDLNFLGSNDNRFYDIAIPQAYAELYAPVGNGLNIKAGHFYTPIGYETVPAPDNFFYTHAYTMQYGEPFTHTGVMGNYAVDSNWSVMGGVVTGSATGGWDGNFNKQLGNWSGLMGGTWTSDDKGTSFNASGTYGGTSEHSSQSWGIYSLVLKHNVTDKFHMMLQHDHGYANSVVTSSASPGTPVDAEWYGINSHWYYDVLDNLAAGIRAEWFRDQKGFRVCSPGRVSAATDGANNSYATGGINTSSCTPGSYYAITAGVNWKPMKWLNIRPNVRYDWVDAGSLAGSGPFGENKKDQFLFSTDMNINF